jgi:hypothetical protein
MSAAYSYCTTVQFIVSMVNEAVSGLTGEISTQVLEKLEIASHLEQDPGGCFDDSGRYK